MLSATGKKWEFSPFDERLSLALSQRHNLPEIISRLLINRGITLESAESYLKPSLRSLLPDPCCLLDMEKALSRTKTALQAKEKIVVYGDYDVDGACSSALLRLYFEQIGHPIDLYIPDRIEEGYGANSQALESLYHQGAKVVLMVDCGTTAHEPLAHAQALGLDVIVLDHHTAEPKLPPTTALINPNRLDQDTLTTQKLGRLCAAGVTFLFLTALQRSLRQSGQFEMLTSEPNLLQFLDLVALATVCDVMPLTDLNRAFVAQGLKILHRRQNLGLKTLSDLTKISEVPTPYHLGFILGPRINAGGRVGKATMGSCLLTTHDPHQAQTLAMQLDQFNQQRQDIEKNVLEEALEQIEKHNLHHHPVIMVSKQGWHPGVIGIVASRLKERYHRPACVVGFEGDIGKGSGRSIAGICLGTAMHTAVHKGLLEKGGGHAMAAGFTVHKTQYQVFYDFLNERMKNFLRTYTPTLRLDGYLSLQALTPEFLTTLQGLEPYGQGNPTPRFAFQDLTIPFLDPVGEHHFRCQLRDQAGVRLKAMAFRARGTELGAFLEQAYHEKKLIQVAGTLHLNSWQGESQITLFIEDGLPRAC